MSGNTTSTAAGMTAAPASPLTAPAAAPAVPDPKMLSLSNIPDDLLPAFSLIDRVVILTCKVVTGKKTEAQAMEMLNGDQ